MSSVLNHIIRYELLSQGNTTAPTGFLRRVLVVAPALDDNLLFATITNPSDIPNYTNDTTVIRLFNGGMTNIDFLGIKSDLSLDLSNVDLTDYFSIVFVPSIDFEVYENDFLSFEGIIYISELDNTDSNGFINTISVN